MIRSSGGHKHPIRWLVPLLIATFGVVVVLFVQGFGALKAHGSVVDRTLAGFVAFGAQRVATELDHVFSALFLDRVAVAREADYRWSLQPHAPSPRPPTGRTLPEGTIPAYFSIVDTTLVSHGPPLDRQTRDRILREIHGHADVYPEPAPYVVLRSTESVAIVYRREEVYGRQRVYGFLVDFEAPRSWYARLVGRTELLPAPLEDTVPNRDLFSVSIHLAPGTTALYSRWPAQGAGPDLPEAWAFAAKAGRLAVRVGIDADRAAPLVAGGAPAASVALLSVLGLLTMCLLYASLVVLRRSNRLAALRESFVANVSHDLRTPITQIRMFSETLRLGRLADAAERRRALEIIQRQAEVLDDLVDNLLHASDRRLRLDPVPTDLVAVVRDVADSLEPLAAQHGCRIDTAVRCARPLRVDPIVVTRILTNLVDNAIRHGVDSGEIRIELTHEDGLVRIVVDDDGPGIPRKDRVRVLERFERLSGTETGVTGAGIGLSVVRSLAQRHGGDVGIVGAQSGGTRVEVRIATAKPDGDVAGVVPDRVEDRLDGPAHEPAEAATRGGRGT